MNREIKFRAWNIPNKLMYQNVQDGLLAQNEKGQLVLGVSLGKLSKDAGSVLMQFTGLFNGSGKEIYEGDILQTSNNIVSVFFGKHTSYVTIFGKKDTIETNGWLVKNAKGQIDVLDESFCNGKIIGNIYENTELFDGSVVA